MGVKVLKVGSGTGAVELGSALAHALYQDRKAVLRAVGPLAVSQAAKAVAIAGQHAAERELKLSTEIEFVDVTMPDGKVSGIAMTVSATGRPHTAPTLK
jgi:stage V sporulation protein SpoVS